jgi:ubiquitin carboxyl-terminal hydrolase 25/28
LLAYNDAREQIFNRLGFTSKPKDPANRDSSVLMPVTTDVSLSNGRQNRAKLLRAWVEISVWLLEYRKKNGRR